jgi:hypothetical protein
MLINLTTHGIRILKNTTNITFPLSGKQQVALCTTQVPIKSN